MLTVGWILTPQHDRARLAEMRLDEPDYTRDGAEAFEITVPKLTVRETLGFDRQLPISMDDFAIPPGLAVADVEAYLRCYGFFPDLRGRHAVSLRSQAGLHVGSSPRDERFRRVRHPATRYDAAAL